MKTLGDIARKDDQESHSTTSGAILKLLQNLEERIKKEFLQEIQIGDYLKAQEKSLLAQELEITEVLF